MRNCGKHIVLLAMMSLALAACGGIGEGSDADAPGANNLPPLIAGTPVTTLAAGSLDFKSAAARAAAKAISDLGHRNNGFVARDDRFSEHAGDLGAGGKAFVQ